MNYPIEVLDRVCRFDNLTDVYILMAIARKKNNSELTSGTEIVFREVIRSKDQVGRKYLKVRALAEHYMQGKYTFNLYVMLNPRDTIKAWFNLNNTLNGWLKEHIKGTNIGFDKFSKIDNYWISELMKPSAKRGRGLWIIDVDTKDQLTMDDVFALLSENFPDKNEYFIVETVHGFHIVTEPFDRRKFDNLKLTEVELKTDSMLFLEQILKK